MRDMKGAGGGILAIIFACFLWGTTGTAASFAPDISALAIGAFAMGMGGVLLVLNALKALLKDSALLLANPRILFVGGVAVAIYPLAFYSSMRLSGVAIGTVVSLASAPLFAALLERLINRKKLSPQWLASFTVGAVGILLLALGKSPSTDGASSSSIGQQLGIVLGLVAGLTYAMYSWAAKQLIERGVHSKSAMAAVFGLASLVLLPTLTFTGGNLFVTPVNAGVAVYMAVVPMFLGYLCFSYGLRYVDVSHATLLTLLEPVVAMMLAVVVVGERFMGMGWCGVGLILISLLMQIVKRPGVSATTVEAGA
ncbi:DMT family transporter [Marinobacterium marinum]|uniref:EamA family transporter n=1 Tax=Marinobacterium marinum TaxID=2756129 RepID=A0A7W2ABN1_9GAMM|nr:EamA family transporter [Marinobacterium marinum]MBA4502230.1 EamA family transporter [Marinobacterium marinum]